MDDLFAAAGRHGMKQSWPLVARIRTLATLLIESEKLTKRFYRLDHCFVFSK
jgi:predicted RNase H-like nuclease